MRDLWNAFDPIGVMGDPEWPRDEYDFYVPHTLRLLMDRDGTIAIANYIEYAVRERMGLPVNRHTALEFARRLEQWFEREECGRSSDRPPPN